MFEEVLTKTAGKDFRCVVARWIDSLEPEDQVMVNKAIVEAGFYVTWKACRNYGYPGSESAFYRHVKGNCPCLNTK